MLSLLPLVGFVITSVQMFREIYRDTKQTKNRNIIREIVWEVLHNEVNTTVQCALKDDMNNLILLFGETFCLISIANYYYCLYNNKTFKVF